MKFAYFLFIFVERSLVTKEKMTLSCICYRVHSNKLLLDLSFYCNLDFWIYPSV